jgi:RNA polymerase sigma-70 factor (ECF subfamily)
MNAAPTPPDLTAVSNEDAETGSLDRLVPAIYDELRRLASGQLRREHGDVSVQTTELVHEAYLRLVDDTRVTSRGRAYFFAAAARAMRQVLVDAARRRLADKRGGGAERVELEDDHAVAAAYSVEVLDLEQALLQLEALSPRQVRVIECRYFGGMNVEETAAALEISPRSVEYDWSIGRAWLYDRLRGEKSTES